jgi:branched-chain amino acid transport system substrate-binding protein
MLRRLVLPLLTLTLAAPASADIRIAVIAPLTGQFQTLGKQVRDGVQKAVADLNAKGGIGGETIVLDVEDDACKAENAAAAANRAAGRGDVLVIGHVCYEAAQAAASVYAQSGIVLISPAVSADSFTDRRAGPSIFRLAAADRAQGLVAGSFLARRYAKARIAILDDGSPYAQPIAEGVHKSLSDAGIREARRDNFDGGAKDYDELAGRLIDDAIDLVFIGGYQADIAAILKSLRAAKSPMVVMGPDSIATTQFTDLAGDRADGTLFTFFTDWRRVPGAARTVADFRASGVEPVGFVLPAYAGVEIWAAARTSAGAPDNAAVASHIQKDTFQTVLGNVAFSDYGSAQIPAFSIFRWQDGNPVQVE